MDMLISISDDVAVKLKERASTSGQSAQAYAAKLVADTLSKPTIDELLAPVRADFAKTGMSEDQLNDFMAGELEAHRREKKARSE
jgi:hypothetical protein